MRPRRETRGRRPKIDPRRADQFLPWLARLVSVGGDWTCREVTCRVDGSLRFVMTLESQEVHVAWSIFRDAGLGIPFRGGSVGLEAGGGGQPPRRHGAVKQVLARVLGLLATARPPLLEQRNREVKELRFGPGLASRLAPDLLQVGVLCVGDVILAETAFEQDRLRLAFSGTSAHLSLAVIPPWQAEGIDSGELCYDYGPCWLTVDQAPKDLALARAAMDQVGYVVALSTHPGMRAVTTGVSAQEEAAPPEPGDAPRSPFHTSMVPGENRLMAALFGAAGSVPALFHSDRECVHFCSYVGGPQDTPHLTHWPVCPPPEFIRRIRFTDTSETEAIMTGAEARFRELLGAPELRDETSMLFALDTCVANVIGDHIPTVVDQARPGLAGLPVLCLQTTLDQRVDNAKLLWKFLVEELTDSSSDQMEGSGDGVNLIGFGGGDAPALLELRQLLGSVGVRVNASILPTFSSDEMSRFGAAAANVLFRSATVEESFELAAPLCTAPVLSPLPPFGIAGTRRWMNAILEELDRPLLSDTWVEESYGELHSEWHRLREAARSHRIALVVMESSPREPDFLFREGVPLVALLEEMGFGLEILVLQTGAEGIAARQTCKGVRKVLGDPDRHEVAEVAGLAALEERFAGGDFELVYSEVLHDRRVTAAGKVPFAFNDFEMGLAGALRTLDRLIAYCRTPFYRRYGSYLERGGW